MKAKLKIITIFICLPLLGFGQLSNPFEIGNRLDSVYRSAGGSQVSFDLDTASMNNQVSSDTIETAATPVIRLPASVNPFDVSHVPVRKSELQKTSVIQSKSQVQTSQQPTGGSGLVVFGVALLSLLLIAIVANVKRSLFTKIFKSFTNDNMLKLTQREENNGLNAGFLILYIVFVLNAASLLYLLFKQNQDLTNRYWLIFFLIVGSIYIIRHISMFVLGLIFPIKKETSQYSFLIAVVNILMGIVLIPINLIIAYAPDPMAVAMTYSVIGILGFAFIIRSTKGLLIGLVNYGTYIFHFFLYLCTFEIVPVLLIYRVFTNMSA